jgi:hypothetical protein
MSIGLVSGCFAIAIGGARRSELRAFIRRRVIDLSLSV